MSYNHATDANVSALAADSGMPAATARAWLNCEAQDVDNPTNPLNIRYWGYAPQLRGPGSNGQPGVGFASYTSAAAGLADAARTLRQMAAYHAVILAIGTHDPLTVAKAIEASPWAAGHYGGGSGRLGCIARQISVPAVSEHPTHVLQIHGSTPVYDHPGGTVIGHVTKAHYDAARHDLMGQHWYHVLEGSIIGRWIPAEPWIDANPL